MDIQTYLSPKEKREHFWYLLILFLVISAFLSWLLLSGSVNPFRLLSHSEREVLKQKIAFEKKQREALQLYDSTMSKISAYKASPGNVLEADIKNDIKLIGSLNEKGINDDSRSVSFNYMATFLEMHLVDVMNLHKSIGNQNLFKGQLDDCRLGLDKNEQRIRTANPTGN